MKISFVIPAYNEEHYIGNCLASIIRNKTTDFYEIIVIDNASTDKTGEMAAGFPGVRVVREPMKGLTKARQRGLMEAKGDYIAYLDADTEMPPAWPTTLRREFEEHPEIVCLSGPFHYNDLPSFQNFIARLLWTISGPPTYWITGFMVLGANFVARRDALIKIGGFDTSIAFYGEDTDIARRLSAVGKVRFKMNFFIMGSGRRIIKEGLIKAFWTYTINYASVAFGKKIVTKEYNDIRL
jgi:glycosyltransferase involved in cell wall biosynthesis